ncbi:MAG: alkaline phosphatase [Myxococcales bacterium]|nr:alkaline phosphatase [Myxococcales bacterium]
MNTETSIRNVSLALALLTACAAPRPFAATARMSDGQPNPLSCTPEPVGTGALDTSLCGLESPTCSEVEARLSIPDPLAGLPLKSSDDRPFDFVVVLSVDGLRPDMISSRTPTFESLKEHATWAENAFTIHRSTTLPSHAAMLSGVDTDRHGITFNAYRPGFGSIRFPGIAEVVRRAGMELGMFVAKYKLIHLIEPSAVSAFHVGGINCERVASQAAPFIVSAATGLAIVHFSETDVAGHRYGWMSPRYRSAAEKADRCSRVLLTAVSRRSNPERTLMIITADHGGHGRRHMSGQDVDRRIPWMATSSSLKSPDRIRRELSTMDTAATVLGALGLPLPHGMVGRPVVEVLGTPQDPNKSAMMLPP